MTTNDFNTVMVISTINSMYGQFPPEVRFFHTIECLQSVKKHIPNCRILFADNSNAHVKDEWRQEICKYAEIFYQVPHNLFSLSANMRVGTKSESEANMMYMALEMLKRSGMIGKRIFKISGRYKISDTFDYSIYERPELEGKYTFVVTPMASTEDNWMTKCTVMWLEQALISFAPENIDELQNIMFGALANMRRTGDCIEQVMFNYIPHEKIVPIQKAHIEGVKAEGGVVNH